MDNQQAKTTDIEIGWVAGFADGEGSFCFRRREGKRKPLIDCHVPVFCINNCHIPSLNHLTEILEKAGLTYWVYWRRKNHPKHSTQWNVTISGLKRIKPFLLWLTPYLFTKQKQAEALIDFINLRESKPYNAPYGDEEFQLVNRTRILNSPKNASTTTRTTSVIR